MLSEEVAKNVSANKTHYYLSVKSENRQDPRMHYKYLSPGMRYPRQRKTVPLGTFFPTIEYSQGNTCSQFFVVTTSNR